MKNTNLRGLIVSYLTRITIVMMVVIFISFALLQMLSATNQARKDASSIFYQIEQILTKNQDELAELETSYSESCLKNAESIAYILQYNPEILNQKDLVELFKVADFCQVDEIHVFDPRGEIIFGTNPEYYGFTFDSGEQMQFFKPMLSDYDLELVQDIMPNTAEGKMVQYSAVWSQNRKFILQVGMYPDSVLQTMEKNELPYIFSLLRANSGVTLIAIDPDSGEILGCTDEALVGLNKTEIGLPEKLDYSKRGQIMTIHDDRSLVVFTKINDTAIGYIEPTGVIYRGIFRIYVYFALGLLCISIIVVLAVAYCMDHFVIENIYEVNRKLRRITEGELDVKVDVGDGKEFQELSYHINEMVDSLLTTNAQLSEAVVQIEKERDMDSLTNLFNRRGLDSYMSEMEKHPEDLKHCALIMADADGLKSINDQYGHEAGDRYLKAVAEIFEKYDTNAIGARQGGDEFVLFLWGYDSKEMLLNTLEVLKTCQDGLYTQITEKVQKEIQFSMGYALDENHLDYQELLKQADSNMYENKSLRKSAR
ncbi:MAG: diguanylate cyclase [Lachnospiraceae bacterium]|nr:diguanylate cyclase [Lachnospiraceae bacterium]